MIRDKVKPEKRAFAKMLRHNPTPAEECLWQSLRGRRLFGLRFRRQTIIRGYIADFYCPKIHLVIEVDGDSHIGREDYDSNRASVFTSLGIETIRFNNTEVIDNSKRVIREINAVVERRLKLPITPFHGPIPEEIVEAWLKKQITQDSRKKTQRTQKN
jgi:very-short-patch-repair endonuclease